MNTATSLGVGGLTGFASAANSYISVIDGAIGTVASQRATLGAHQTQLGRRFGIWPMWLKTQRQPLVELWTRITRQKQQT